MNEDEFPNQLDEMRPEYALTELLKSGVRGKYAERYRQGTNVVCQPQMWLRHSLQKQM
jgi:hypothetical protein